MKKLLLCSILFCTFLLTTKAFMPAFPSDFTIGRIDKIEQIDADIQFNFDNFVYYKISDKFRVFEEKNTFIDEMVTVEDIPLNLSLKKGDIVAHASVWSKSSPGILKITCENDIMKVEGTKNKYFGTAPSKPNIEIIKNFQGNDDAILQKMNDQIGCENLQTFFDTDRRLQDLHGQDIKKQIYGISGILLGIFSTIMFVYMGKKGKNLKFRFFYEMF